MPEEKESFASFKFTGRGDPNGWFASGRVACSQRLPNPQLK
jgi:hypothetical protein